MNGITLNARLFLLIGCLLAAAVYTVGAFDWRDKRWSRIQCAVLAVITYAAAVAIWIGWGA